MNILIPNIVLTLQNLVAVLTAVRWQRDTNPVMFGHNITLTCMVGIQEGCDNTVTRRWDEGPDRKTLVINGHSTNSSKYYEICEEPCKNFSIVIIQFDRNDVNREYWCSFGFETSRQMLVLDDRHFIGVPVPENSSALLTLKKNEKFELDFKISFYKVYPQPTCKIKIGGDQWLDATILSKPMGIFFNSRLHYTTTIEKHQCTDGFISICRVLNYTILQFNKRLNCTYTVQNKDSNALSDEALTALTMAVFMILVLFFAIIISFLIRKKGYIRSISEHFLGYPGNTRYEVRNVSSHDEADGIIRLTSQQEHPSRGQENFPIDHPPEYSRLDFS